MNTLPRKGTKVWLERQIEILRDERDIFRKDVFALRQELQGLREATGYCSQCGPGHAGADGLCKRHGKRVTAPPHECTAEGCKNAPTRCEEHRAPECDECSQEATSHYCDACDGARCDKSDFDEEVRAYALLQDLIKALQEPARDADEKRWQKLDIERIIDEVRLS